VFHPQLRCARRDQALQFHESLQASAPHEDFILPPVQHPREKRFLELQQIQHPLLDRPGRDEVEHVHRTLLTQPRATPDLKDAHSSSVKPYRHPTPVPACPEFQILHARIWSPSHDPTAARTATRPPRHGNQCDAKKPGPLGSGLLSISIFDK
jgi:hypothetical protein